MMAKETQLEREETPTREQLLESFAGLPETEQDALLRIARGWVTNLAVNSPERTLDEPDSPKP